jgi:4'-phosphopantetheinyl transferase
MSESPGGRPLCGGAWRPLALRPAAPTVRAWSACLERTEEDLLRLASWLDAGELDRAASFREKIHRESFVAARGLLRCALGELLSVAPGRIELWYSPTGKPSLTGESLEINLSHSGLAAVLAVSSDGPVGIDVEVIREVPDALALADRFLPAPEGLALRSCPPADRSALFLRFWTAAEALLKADGAGLSGLETLPSVLAPGGGVVRLAEIVRWRGRAWRLREAASLELRIAVAFASADGAK